MIRTIVISVCLLLSGVALICFKSSHPDEAVEPVSDRGATGAAVYRPTRAKGSFSRWEKLTDSSIRWQIRVDRLRTMQKVNLSKQDVDTLYELLDHRPSYENAEDWWVVVNEVMEQMRKQGIGSERYTHELLEIIKDAAAPEVLRDYAVQHLGQWVSPRQTAIAIPHEQDPALIRQAVSALGELITEPSLAQTSIPGTTLMVLVDMEIGAVSEEIMTEVIATLHPWIDDTLSGFSSVSRVTQISTVNAVAMLQLRHHLPAIRRLAFDKESDPSLRLSSVAALGHIGGPEDLSFLQQLASSETKYRFAAATALDRLQKSLIE